MKSIEQNSDFKILMRNKYCIIDIYLKMYQIQIFLKIITIITKYF